jgi:hypothetical protein
VVTVSEGEAAYWKVRARALEEANGRLRARLASLARRLPLEHLDLLAFEPEETGDAISALDPLDGWQETTELTHADLASDLTALWDRLRSPERG